MFKVFYLSYCPHSIQTINSLKLNSRAKYELVECDDRTKLNEDLDSKFIPNNYKTYPKILFKNKKKTLFVGGNQEFQNILALLNVLKENSQAEIPEQKYIKEKKEICNILLNLIN
jgi:hypothetical protein